MCGIAGILDFSGGEVSRAAIGEMVGMIRHRGPDGQGIYSDKGIGLGACRLSILDLSAAGQQPMLDAETGNCIVHNGEVYNYKELRGLIGGEGFRSQTDTEVILKLYAKYGPECVRFLNGIYAFCIWDPKHSRLFCARDRLGVKPFFYRFDQNAFSFASEIKSLLLPGIIRKPNMKIIYDYLVHGVYDHCEDTFFDGVRQLPPGSTLTIERNRFEVGKYWDITADCEALDGTDILAGDKSRSTIDKFLEILNDSIRLQLRSDVPIAVHVSGGLDSTLMLTILNKVNGGQGSLKAFSYYYGEERYDERAFVEKLVKKVGWEVEYHPLFVSEVPELMQKVMWYQEQPFPGIITMAKHKLVAASHSFGAKVILEGQGGDEIGGGYQYYFGAYILDLIESGYADLALSEIRAFGRQNELSIEGSFAMLVNGLASYYRTGWSADGTHFVKKHCLQPDFLTKYANEVSFPKPFKSHLLNMQYRDVLHTKLPRILRSCDRASMAYGRELRVPLLDHRLVEFAFSLPGIFKIRNGVQRAFMRESLRSLLQTDLADVPKRTVVDPQREWLKGPLRDWVEDIYSSRSFRERGICDQFQVQEEYRKYRSAPNNANSFFLWQWLSLELWFRTFFG